MSQQKPWSDSPNAPKITYKVYFEEKANFAGVLIGSILYGMSKNATTYVAYLHSVRSFGYSRDRYRVVLQMRACAV